MDYWQAAWTTAKANPLLGTGPGTFAEPYGRIKKPESEMARLCHNDYLEQATDSGFPAAMIFTAFIVGAMIYTGKRHYRSPDTFEFALWLGLAALAAQSLVEFGLYIPALAWPFFLGLGHLTFTAKEILAAKERKEHKEERD
jgi:O-antigen ligase